MKCREEAVKNSGLKPRKRRKPSEKTINETGVFQPFADTFFDIVSQSGIYINE